MGNIRREEIYLKEFDDPDLRRVQKLTIDLTVSDTDSLLAKYASFAEAHNGGYINSDLMKMVFDIYSKSAANRGRYNLAITNSAACLANECYIRAINNPKVKRCKYIAGPYGAGKSFFAQSLFLAGVIPDDTIVYEGSITAPAFGKKVKLAIERGVEPEIIVLNPTLELSLRNIRQREIETGRGVIKEEVIAKYADIYSNIEQLFMYLNREFPDLQQKDYPIAFQIYNKKSNVPEDLSVSYKIGDLQHGTREEISAQYDVIMRKIALETAQQRDEPGI